VKEEKKLVGGTGNISIRAHYNRNRPSERKNEQDTTGSRMREKHGTTFTLSHRDEDEKSSRHIRSERRGRHKTGRLVSSSK